MTKLDDIAKAAASVNNTIDFDDFTQCVLDSIESNKRWLEIASYAINIPFEKIYADYMASIDKDSLTDLEEKQALLDWTLEGGMTRHDQT